MAISVDTQGGSPALGDDAEKSLGQLMGDVVAEMGTLVRQEIALAKVETKEEIGKTGKAAGLFGGAALAGHMALLFLSLALAWLLSQVMNRALAFAVVGVLYALGSGLLALRGRQQARSISPMPEQTVETLKEDVQWAKAQRN